MSAADPSRDAACLASGILAGAASCGCLLLGVLCWHAVTSWRSAGLTLDTGLCLAGLGCALGAAVRLFGVALGDVMAYHDAWEAGLRLACTSPWRVPAILRAHNYGRERTRS